MKPKIWLVTGGAGFIGGNFVRKLVGMGQTNVVVLDALTYAAHLAGIEDLISTEQICFVHADIRQLDSVRDIFQRHDVERVVHFAAESHVDRSISGPLLFVDTNVVGTLNLLIAAHESWQGSLNGNRFLHVSTDEVYGALEPGDAPFSETSPYAPNSPYAASKAASDHLVRAWHNTYGLPTLTTHCSNNYGPWQYPEKLIPLTIMNASEGRELPVYGDGQQVRDWVHVDDHCEALLAVMKGGALGQSYCIGGNNQRSNLGVVEAICDIVDVRLGQAPKSSRRLIRHVKDRPGHDRRYATDIVKITRELGWTPRFEFSTALPDVVDWYLRHGHRLRTSGAKRSNPGKRAIPECHLLPGEPQRVLS
jgi:dTDP-glucose 4,6-dehydratase